MRFPIDVILVCIRWYAAYPLSYRHLKEMMQERGVSVDHSSINRWAIRLLPLTMDAINAGRDVPILVRQVKYLNNIVERDHRATKRVTRQMINFKSFQSAGCVLVGIELMHMIRKRQFAIDGVEAMSFADQFFALAGIVRPV